MKPKVLFTDGEGPIVFKDLAADMTEKIVPGLFPMISLYDDYLAETGREGYQAGDTLALVVPHFLAHGVGDEDIREEAKDAKVCKGVEEYISGLKQDGWEVRIISTAYSQLWELVGKHIGIPMQDIAYTNLDLEDLNDRFGSFRFLRTVRREEQEILSLSVLSDEASSEVDKGRDVVEVFNDPQFQDLRTKLDGFYFGTLKNHGYEVLNRVIVMGGKRKVRSAEGFARNLGIDLSDVAYVGDSITDDAMHFRLKQEGGLPIAINGNAYALRNAKVAVATEDMRNIRPILDAWQLGGIEGVSRKVQESQVSFMGGSKEGAPRHENLSAHYHLVDWENPSIQKEVREIHGEYRRRVRGAATARLG